MPRKRRNIDRRFMTSCYREIVHAIHEVLYRYNKVPFSTWKLSQHTHEIEIDPGWLYKNRSKEFTLLAQTAMAAKKATEICRKANRARHNKRGVAKKEFTKWLIPVEQYFINRGRRTR